LLVSGTGLMYLNGAKQVDSQAEAAMASMQVHGVPQTPSNFSVWYAYHSGQNPDLTRTIEVLVSNNCPIDDQTLDQLYEKYFRSPVADMVLCDTSIRARETLKTVLDLVERVRSDASGIGAAINDISTQLHTNVSGLAELIDSLVEETGKIAGRSERLGLDLKQSVDKIGALERTLQDVRREATTDGLTGIANRRYFDMSLQTMSGDAMNSGDDLSLLLVDIDHFKKVNDTWGHATGDEVIQLVAEALTQAVKGQDCVARYGGEEFAVILPGTSIDAAVRVGDNVRTALGRRLFVPRTAPQAVCTVTVSVGVACYEPGESLSQWVQRTDAALYQAKRSGRNRVVSAGVPCTWSPK
jgi:diguanylate cyclase